MVEIFSAINCKRVNFKTAILTFVFFSSKIRKLVDLKAADLTSKITFSQCSVDPPIFWFRKKKNKSIIFEIAIL